MSRRKRKYIPVEKFTLKSCTHPVMDLHGGTLTGGKVSTADTDLYILLSAQGIGGFAFDTRGELFSDAPRVVFYPIKDMDVPKDSAGLESILTLAENTLKKGEHVHIQCVGGHGRTGTIMALLFTRAGIKNPIEYVRKTYCKHAIEGWEQEAFICRYAGLPEPPIPVAVKTFSRGGVNTADMTDAEWDDYIEGMYGSKNRYGY